MALVMRSCCATCVTARRTRTVWGWGARCRTGTGTAAAAAGRVTQAAPGVRTQWMQTHWAQTGGGRAAVAGVIWMMPGSRNSRQGRIVKASLASTSTLTLEDHMRTRLQEPARYGHLGDCREHSRRGGRGQAGTEWRCAAVGRAPDGGPGGPLHPPPMVGGPCRQARGTVVGGGAEQGAEL